MLGRAFALLAVQLLGGVLGWWAWADMGALLGAIAGGLVWLVMDQLRAQRAMEWLRQGDPREPPGLGGFWGELIERVQRSLRRREQGTLEAEARLDAFLSGIQASPNGVLLLTADNRIEWCNQTAAEHFGLNPERDIAQHLGNLLRDPAFAHYVAQQDFSHELELLGPRSTPGRPVRLSAQLHPYGEGRKLLLSRDVTVLEQAERMKRDFVANVSHEIRTPLTVIGGFIETMQTLTLPQSERQRYLGLMERQSNRMQTLVGDLLTLSKLEGSPLPGVTEWTPMAELMKDCEDEAHGLAQLLGSDTHRIQFDCKAPCLIAGTRSELRSAMGNLVSNALRYTPAGGSVAVSWELLADGQGAFQVADTGPGIAPEHLPRLTERFYRVDTSRSRETGGTGLGLAIDKHVAQRHGGELKIDSQLGAGSRFTLVVPANRLRAG